MKLVCGLCKGQKQITIYELCKECSGNGYIDLDPVIRSIATMLEELSEMLKRKENSHSTTVKEK